MANEISISASLSYNDGTSAIEILQAIGIFANVATKRFIRQVLSVTITEIAIPRPAVSLGWFIGINRDPLNFIEILTGTGGIHFARLLPGEPTLVRLGSGVTAPFAIADTAACLLELLLIAL